MHIAICDDNVADRKQLERLLGRESDKRKTDSDAFYCDSYGNSVNLGRNPMPYDLFFIDMTSEEPTGLSFALSLRSMGVTAPIVLCSSSINYKKDFEALDHLTKPNHILFLNKPILKQELSDIIDEAVSFREKREPTIELRGEKETFYVFEDDIIYANQCKLYVDVLLKNGRHVEVLDSMSNFFSQVKMYGHYKMVSAKTMVNIMHVSKIQAFSVRMDEGTNFRINPASKSGLQKAISRENHAK